MNDRPNSMSMFASSADYWKAEAQRYAQNADHWRNKFGEAEARIAELGADVRCSEQRVTELEDKLKDANALASGQRQLKEQYKERAENAEAQAKADAEDAARHLLALKSARPWVALLLEETKVQLYKQNCLQSLQEIDAAIDAARERGNG